MDDRNRYMLKGKLARRGYDWWWHSLVAINAKTGQKFESDENDDYSCFRTATMLNQRVPNSV